MKSKVLLGVVVVVASVVLVGLGVVSREREVAEPSVGYDGSQAESTHPATESIQASAQSLDRVAVPPRASQLPVRNGMLLNTRGEGLVDVTLQFVGDGGDRHDIVTGERGRFSVPGEMSGGACKIAADQYVLLNAPDWECEEPFNLIAATRRVVHGVVVSKENKLPLADATVTLHQGAEWTRLLKSSRSWRGFERKSCKTDLRGEFEFRDLADVGGSLVDTQKLGYASEGAPLAQGSQFVVLEIQPTEGLCLRGVVVDAFGRGVGGAVVGIGVIGVDVKATDASGMFVLEYRAEAAPRELRVVSLGLGAVTWPVSDVTSFLVVRMPPEQSIVSGLVVDQGGAPVEGALVSIEAKTLVGSKVIEGPAALGNGVFRQRVYVEDMMSQGVDRRKTGSDGRFAFPSSGVGAIPVLVIDPITLASHRQEMSPQVETKFVLQRSDLQSVRCLVVDSVGIGVPGVDVAIAIRMDDGLVDAMVKKTDGEGRGAFAVARSVDNLTFRVDGAGLVSQTATLQLLNPELRLVVQRSCAVRIFWGAAKPGSHITAETQEGDPVSIRTVGNGASLELLSIQVQGECSHVVRVTERAVAWTWMDREGRIRRTPFVPSQHEDVSSVQL